MAADAPLGDDSTLVAGERILRIARVYAKRQQTTHPRPEESLQGIVEESLRALHARVDAVLTIPDGIAHELTAVGERRADGRTVLRDVDRAWLARVVGEGRAAGKPTPLFPRLELEAA